VEALREKNSRPLLQAMEAWTRLKTKRRNKHTQRTSFAILHRQKVEDAVSTCLLDVPGNAFLSPQLLPTSNSAP
jgi:hypothetical protein